MPIWQLQVICAACLGAGLVIESETTQSGIRKAADSPKRRKHDLAYRGHVGVA